MGVALEYNKNITAKKKITENKVDALIEDFCYYLSDDSKQDSSTNTAHIADIINNLFTKKVTTQYVSKVREETDGNE